MEKEQVERCMVLRDKWLATPRDLAELGRGHLADIRIVRGTRAQAELVQIGTHCKAAHGNAGRHQIFYQPDGMVYTHDEGRDRPGGMETHRTGLVPGRAHLT